MKILIVSLLAVVSAMAAVDGTVTNATTGKPQANATVTLFQPTQQGPQFVESVKSDAQGKFTITKQPPSAAPGPLLLQAAYAGVQYNKILTPATPTTDVQVLVYESSPSSAGTSVIQHVMLIEPNPSGQLLVAESYMFQNTGKTTWNDPKNGTLKFVLPAAAAGKVEVSVLAPGGMPIRRAADKTAAPNVFKVDFPIKPGESRIDLEWAMPFTSPGKFDNKVLAKSTTAMKILAPVGVTLEGAGVSSVGKEPSTGATIYAVEGPDLHLDVTGTGSLAAAPNGGDDAGGGSPPITQNLPKLYGLLVSSAGLVEMVSAVKWVLLSVLGMLAIGFTLLYRKGNPK